MASQGSNNHMKGSSEVKLEQGDSSNSINTHIFTLDETFKATYDHVVYSALTEEAVKEKLIQFADNAADELYKMASSGSPLWQLDDLKEEILDNAVYQNMFMSNMRYREELQGVQIMQGADPIMITPTHPMIIEASRSSGNIHKKPLELISMFMDVEQWMEMFPNIVSSARIIGKILDDGNDHDGSLTVMKAEFGFPTPYPTTRECYFIRRSKQVNEHCWLIVDVSLDLPGLKYYRKPSGCLIEQVDDSCSKIIWVEHNEISLEGCFPVLFKELVSSGFVFLAGDVERSNLLKLLAHRMSQICMKKMNASTKKIWNSRKSIENDGYVFANTEFFENNLGRPNGKYIITVAASLQLPFDADKLYDSLQCVECRPKWDISMLGAAAKEEMRITFEHDPSAYVSVLNVKVPGIEPMKCLQACFLNSISMYMIWTVLNTKTMNAIMQGGVDPDTIEILVSGAAVLPWHPTIEDGGSVLTLAFESLDETEDSAAEQVRQDALYSVITKTLTMGIITCTPPFESNHGSSQ
ncbi:hypothetical protein QVD17_14106 [Tagetes erecta]|uniref:START domain-containing protein n=1 Tax=Tagetes erecta TaxID=13708 RepID=A0AAD8L1D3_TARER|nr:hypothetical protein QVD17_14106 [Tagetes erecta]